MLEKAVEAKYRKKTLAAGGLLLKFVSPGAAGVPDRIEILPGGKVRFIEFKRLGEKPRPLQQYWIKKLKGLGVEAIVIDSVD